MPGIALLHHISRTWVHVSTRVPCVQSFLWVLHPSPPQSTYMLRLIENAKLPIVVGLYVSVHGSVGCSLPPCLEPPGQSLEPLQPYIGQAVSKNGLLVASSPNLAIIIIRRRIEHVSGKKKYPEMGQVFSWWFSKEDNRQFQSITKDILVQ